ncbi:MAG: bifunctional 2-methylcitrate synthase/citrate synthase [Phycisphaerales bacterium]|nr:MAG: bifunctional 2-methylcitrate synthase/citrate synthase [Phycisphaerales bacterium]
MGEFKPGLEGVIAGQTDICCVDQGKLLYRGYPIAELAEKASFTQVAHLLLYGELPTESQHAEFVSMLDGFHGLAPGVIEAIRRIPKQAPMMDVLRTGVSMAGHFDPVAGASPEDLRRRAVWLLAVCSDVVATRFRLINGKEPVPPRPGLPHAAQILYMCHGSPPDDTSARLLELTLILYAEHDFNASTFACRVIGSTESDMVSSVVGAIGALKGPLHGGANEKAMELILQFKSAQEADAWVRDVLARKGKVMGFGHRVYKHGDHRAHILEREMRQLAKEKGRQDLVAIYDAIKDPIVNKDKPIYPNVDYPCGLTYYLMDLPLDLYTPLFVCSRVSGWCAHYIEQQTDNRIYRPLSHYTGPAVRPVP